MRLLIQLVRCVFPKGPRYCLWGILLQIIIIQKPHVLLYRYFGPFRFAIFKGSFAISHFRVWGLMFSPLRGLGFAWGLAFTVAGVPYRYVICAWYDEKFATKYPHNNK